MVLLSWHWLPVKAKAGKMIWQLLSSLFFCSLRVCTYSIYVGLCVHTVRVLGLCVSACSCSSLSASTHVVSHFELLLSDGYRLSVCVVAEASQQHFALFMPLDKVTVEDPHWIQRQEKRRNTLFKRYLKCLFECERHDVLNWGFLDPGAFPPLTHFSCLVTDLRSV